MNGGMGWDSQIMRALRKFIPQDPYQHAAYLLEPAEENPQDFPELLNKHSILGNISDDTIMRLYQNDVYFLVKLFELAKRDEALRPVFYTLYTIFNMEISLTRNYKGMERQLQALVNALRNIGGYGAQISKKLEEGGGTNLPELPTEVIYYE